MEKQEKNVVIIYSRYSFKNDLSKKHLEHTKMLIDVKQRLERTFGGVSFIVTDSLDAAKRSYDQNIDAMLGVIAEGSRFLKYMSAENRCPFVGITPGSLTTDLAAQHIVSF